MVDPGRTSIEIDLPETDVGGRGVFGKIERVAENLIRWAPLRSVTGGAEKGGASSLTQRARDLDLFPQIFDGGLEAKCSVSDLECESDSQTSTHEKRIDACRQFCSLADNLLLGVVQGWLMGAQLRGRKGQLHSVERRTDPRDAPGESERVADVDVSEGTGAAPIQQQRR